MRLPSSASRRALCYLVFRSKVSFASLKSLSSWVKDMIYRIDFMRSWLRNGQPSSFALPVFFFPQGFMTGTTHYHFVSVYV